MLAHRIATAVALLLVFIAALSTQAAWPFAALMLLLVGASMWEWGRLVGASNSMAWGWAALLVVALAFVPWPSAASTAAEPQAGLWWGASILWALGGAWALRAGVLPWQRCASGVKVVIGLIMLFVTWHAIVAARAQGINFMMSVLMLVWASDVAAYFGGRAWGGRWFGARKLAPSISPGKTLEGAACAMTGALALAATWVLWVDRQGWVDGPSFYSRVLEQLGPWALALACVTLVVAGIVGDLFESLIKRAAGAKDSSRLLPGHGGVLDRLDALLPVIPMALAWVSI